jgi:hypothetical protein
VEVSGIRKQLSYKNINKAIIVTFLFIIVFTALSAVNTVSADSSIIYVNDSGGNDSWDGQYAEWILGTFNGPKKSIKNATGTVDNGGTINIANGNYFGENNTNITINKNMTVVGESRDGTIINGTNSAQIFTIQNGSTVTIKNLTFVNGTASQSLTLPDRNITAGGAICNFGDLTIFNSNFIGNTASSEEISDKNDIGGGAVFNVGNLTVTGCNFIGNTATGNLTGDNGTVGGAICNFGNLTVTNSNFTGNTATAGGAIYSGYNSTLNPNGGILNIDGSTFSGNHATGNSTTGGGAIASERYLNIKNSVFKGNKAISTNGTAIGGAILGYGNLTITGSKFGLDALTGNSAVGKDNASTGGAIIIYGNLTINSSEFSYNTAYYGSAISNAGNLTIKNGTFVNNTAIGGAIFNIGNLTLTGCNFAGNKATNTDVPSVGGAVLNAGNLTVTDSKFTNNNATNGGAIGNLGNATVINSTFTGNKVSSTNNTVINYGGAIYNGGNLTVTGSSFTSNKAFSTSIGEIAYGGGAISNFKTSTIKNSKFSGNTADFGGAISNMGKLNISGSSFTGNKATSSDKTYTLDGGAISNVYGTLNINSSSFTGNIADLGGAVSNWANSTAVVSGSTFAGNNATADGGAIYNEGKLTVHFCRIIGNLLKVPQYVSSTGHVLDDIDNYKGSADVKYNWWGSNVGPSSGRVYGATTGPWLVLTLNASPTTVKAKGTSTITASFLYDSNGVYHSPSSGHVPDGMAVSFTTQFGSITSKSTTVNGIAKSTLKAGSTGGTVSVSAKTDSQTVQIPLKVISTYPKNGATGCSKTATITIKFSQNIKASTYWSKIYVKNLKTGKIVSISKSISGDTISIKMSSKRYAYNWYQVYIPASAVKTYSGSNLSKSYTFKFKTGG